MSIQSTPGPDTSSYTIGWICALDTEYTAARAFLDERYNVLDQQDPADTNTYTLGRVGKHNVVIAISAEYGAAAAAIAARDMVRTFTNVRIGLLIGIGGGVPSQGHDIRLGDVVVSVPDGAHPAVIQYDMGRQLQDGTFEVVGQLAKPPALLLTCVRALRSTMEEEGNDLHNMVSSVVQDFKKSAVRAKYQRPPAHSDVLYEADYCHPTGSEEPCFLTCQQDPKNVVKRVPRPEDDDLCVIHYGPIASANRVMKDALERDRLLTQHRVLCCEMEAAGLSNHWPCITIRGICDYADSHKNQDWQGYAAMVAAAYAKLMLQRLVPGQLEASSTFQDLLQIQAGLTANVHEVKVIQEESLQIQRQMVKIQRTSEEYECIRAFKLHDYEGYKDINPSPTKGTCQWVYQSPIFHHWSKAAEKVCLWISADPGCGKSVLAKSLVDEMLPKNHPGTKTCHFFFKDNETQNELASALCSILHQLYDQNQWLVQHALQSWRNNGTKLLSDCGKLWSILLASCSDITAAPVICVFDALDEARQRDQRTFVQFLSKLRTKENCRLKVLVTSRPYLDIEDDFRKLVHDLPEIRLRGEMENDQISSEIDMVIRFSVQELARDYHLSPTTERNIMEKLLKMRNRTYLWLRLILDDLRAEFKLALDPDAVQVSAVPSSVEAAYEKLLNRTATGQTVVVRTIFKIIVGAHRPFTIAELAVALGIVTKSSYQTLADARLPVAGLESRIRHLCGLFVFFNDSKLYLIHQTAKEFLLRSNTKADISSSWSFSPAEAEAVMALFCIKYIILAEPEIIPWHGATQDEIMAYAADNWPQHYRVAKEHALIQEIELVMQLYDDSGPFYSRWWYGFTAESNAARHGHLDVLSLLIARDDTAIYQSRCEADSPLICAAEYGHMEAVKLLLDAGVDIDQQDDDGDRALHMAARMGQTAIVEFLLERGANTAAVVLHSQGVLQGAALEGQEGVINFLLKSGFDVNAQDDSGQTALQCAASRMQETTVKMLLENGADVSVQGGYYGTALQAAAASGHGAIAKILLEHGADIDAYNGSQGTALQAALSRWNQAVAEMLVEYGADVNVQGGDYGTALQAAVHAELEVAVEMLLEHGADVNGQDGPNGSALQSAANHGNVKIVEMLLEYGADVNAKGSRWGTALQAAAYSGQGAVVEILLEHGADVNAQGEFYGTGLRAAAASGDERIVQMLIQSGAEVNAPDTGRCDALNAPNDFYRGDGGVGVMKVLLEAGAVWHDIDLTNALHKAFCERNNDILELMWTQCAETQLPYGLTRLHLIAQAGIPQLIRDTPAILTDLRTDQLGRTVLHCAANNINTHCIRLLAERCDGIDTKDDCGWTPLHWAAHFGNDRMIRVLIDRGADVSARDRDGLSAYQIATWAGHGFPCELLDSLQGLHADGGPAGEAMQPGRRFSSDCKCCHAVFLRIPLASYQADAKAETVWEIELLLQVPRMGTLLSLLPCCGCNSWAPIPSRSHTRRQIVCGLCELGSDEPKHRQEFEWMKYSAGSDEEGSMNNDAGMIDATLGLSYTLSTWTCDGLQVLDTEKIEEWGAP